MGNECYDSLILDVDGVVWLEGTRIEENLYAVRKAIDAGLRVVFLTNNSTRSRKVYSILLSDVVGRSISVDQIVNSAYSAAKWLAKEKGPSKVYPIGEEGLITELHEAGHTVFNVTEWKYADVVAVGLDRHLTYHKLAAAHNALTRNNAYFLITNRDPAYPVEEGSVPGAGAIVSFLETSTGRPADHNAGKPCKWILDLALEHAGRPVNPLLVGDRVDIDVAMALNAGIDALLVLTGVTRDPPRNRNGFIVAESLSAALEKGLVRFCKG